MSGLIRLIQKKNPFFFEKISSDPRTPYTPYTRKKNPLSEISEKWSWLIQARIHEKNPITRKETLRVIVATPQSFLEVENLYRFFG